MRYLIMLEQTEAGFAVQVPDLVVVTHGDSIESAKCAAAEAIRINLDAYQELGMPVPAPEPVSHHIENPDNRDLLFAYVDVADSADKAA
jgi:predicted RNase H-like HicB family nuclease